MPDKRQHIHYWIITVCVLLLMLLLIFLFQSQFKQAPETEEPYNITTSFEVTPGRYYQTGGQFHLDMTGTSKIILPIKKPPDILAQYPFLVINKLTSNQAINIYLTAQISSPESWQTIDFKQQLNTDQYSVNPLSLPWNQASEIADVSLVIESELSLGFGNEYDSQISWQSILFTQDAHINPLRKWFSQMTSFEPLGFASINFHDGNSTQFYQLVLSILATWLLICFLIYCVIKPAPVHLIMSLALAWFFMTLIYGFNFSRQINYNQQRFAQHSPHLNRSDQSLHDIASEISQTIDTQLGEKKTAKILIYGGDKFNRNRLNYHLLQYNVGLFNHSGLALNQYEMHDLFLILLPPRSNSCSQFIHKAGLNTTKPLIEQSEYCLVNL